MEARNEETFLRIADSQVNGERFIYILVRDHEQERFCVKSYAGGWRESYCSGVIQD